MLIYCAVLPPALFAHESGLALKATSGQYTVDVHYPFDFEQQKPISLNFFLSNSETKESVGFSDLDVSIIRDDHEILKTNIRKRIGIATGVVMTFPEAGAYKLALAFNDNGNKIAETTFNISVDPESGRRRIIGIEFNKELAVGVAVGALIATVVMWYLRYMRSIDVED